nr:MAG TPA: hypothetical protein [Caudoviricetes sp.]
MEEERMLYRRYKISFSDCETIPESYDKESKTIVVLLPAGRMKPSGTRGRTYRYMEFNGTENATGRKVRCAIKAVSRENAIKRLPSDCTWDI